MSVDKRSCLMCQGNCQHTQYSWNGDWPGVEGDTGNETCPTNKHVIILYDDTR